LGRPGADCSLTMKVTHSWTEAHIQSLRDVTPTVREFTIRPSGPVLAHAPGSHLQLQMLVSGKPQTRSYSLIGAPDGEAYRIAVKRLDDGRGGSLAMWQLEVGDRLQVSEPQNHFPLALDAPAYLLVAGGIGITPLLLIAQTLAGRQAPVRMAYGARSPAELAYLPELQAALGDRLQTAVAEQGEQLDFAAGIAALPAGAHLVVCGPATKPLAAAAASHPRRFVCSCHATRSTSPCRPMAACWIPWKRPVCRPSLTASVASAACARWTCWRWTARSTTAMCS
jgi:ferredoxin-NADP reductase